MKLALKIILIAALLSCKTNSSDNEKEEYETVSEVTTNVPEQKSESYKRGKDIYNDFCLTCHLPNGEGIAGTYPPLDGSNWLTEKRKESIHAVKYGLKGPITVNGKSYNSVMAPMGLTDQEIADVMNYINNSWSNNIKEPVTVEEVAAISE